MQGTWLSDDGLVGGAASCGPKSALALDEPVEKHGSEVADGSMTTPAEERRDLD